MQQIFSSIPSSASAHWVDGILFCILLFYAIEGFISGAVFATFDLITFVASFLSGLIFYGSIGKILTLILGASKGYANALGFFLAAFLTELILHLLFRIFIKKVNVLMLSLGPFLKRMNNIIGILPGVLSGTVLVMFVVTVLTALPVSPFIKHAISDSTLGSFFSGRSEVLQKTVAGAFGGVAEETLNFLTVEPQSNASVSLGFTTKNAVIDASAEKQMLTMVNEERQKRGIAPITQDISLQNLARKYALEMLTRGYFSHYTPEGLSPFDRMNQAGIPFTYAGENLAFSANVQLAMQGLMNSKGHRENILSTNYHKVGIGVMDAGIYGEMFVQDFTN